MVVKQMRPSFLIPNYSGKIEEQSTAKGVEQNLMKDICISGAGLAGMTLSVALAQLGVSSCLVDRQSLEAINDPDADRRTTAISWTTKRLLERLDLWKFVGVSATPIKSILVTGQCDVKLRFDPADVGLTETGFIVSNTDLRKALIERIQATPEIEFATGQQIISFNGSSECVSCEFENGNQRDFRLLVACDGQNSLISQKIAIAPFKRSYEQTAFVATVGLERSHDGIAFQVFGKTGPLALLPLPDGKDSSPRASLIWSHNQATTAEMTSLAPNHFIALLNRLVGIDFPNVISVEGPVKSFPLNARFVPEVYQGRVLLLGEAAHNLHPLAGQGFNLTARDIGTLYDELEAARKSGLEVGKANTLAAYQKRRTADAAKMLTVVDTLDAMLGGDTRLPKPLRALGFALVDQSDDLRKRLIREAMGFTDDLPTLMS